MDPDRFKLGQQVLVPKAPERKPASRKRVGGKFLKGPVPLNWLARAGQLPGKSLHVGIVLWFLAGLRRNHEVALSNGMLKLFGVDRYAKYRALDCLKQDGLIKWDQRIGQSPRVTLLDVGDTDEGS